MQLDKANLLSGIRVRLYCASHCSCECLEYECFAALLVLLLESIRFWYFPHVFMEYMGTCKGGCATRVCETSIERSRNTHKHVRRESTWTGSGVFVSTPLFPFSLALNMHPCTG